MTEIEVSKVRTAIKEVKGIYRKRVTGTKQEFRNKEEYKDIVDAADTAKLAKMLRILGSCHKPKSTFFGKKKQKTEKRHKTLN